MVKQNKKLMYNIEKEGNILSEYPTDDFGGSNTGDGTLYCYRKKLYEITKERGTNKIHFGKVDKRTVRKNFRKACK